MIDHEIFSMVILFLWLIQMGWLSVSGKKNVHKYWLMASRKVDWAVKPQHKQNQEEQLSVSGERMCTSTG